MTGKPLCDILKSVGGGVDFVLNEDSYVWITVGTSAVRVMHHSKGVEVSIYTLGSEDYGPWSTASAIWSELIVDKEDEDDCS